MKQRKRLKKDGTRKQAILREAERWRVPSDLPCDACGAPRRYHAPLCAEPDPLLVTFWVSTCERCLLERDQAAAAYRNVRQRGWAREGKLDAPIRVQPSEHAAAPR